DRVLQELKGGFRPEFLNRVDEVIVFRELSRQNVKEIVDLMIRRVRDQLASQDVGIELTDAAKDLLAEQGYDPALGARPLRRAIQRLVEDPLSEKILWKEFFAGQTIVVEAEVDPDDPAKRVIVFRVAPPAPEIPPVELAESGTAEA
ncbi:MAG: NDP-hexose 4-ketoreductase, partial [Actinomycetota bacterium]